MFSAITCPKSWLRLTSRRCGGRRRGSDELADEYVPNTGRAFITAEVGLSMMKKTSRAAAML
jgi:hypothetical protein